jgi:hypothetical protein
MSPLRARVENGRLHLDEPTELPEGTELALVVDDDGDDLADQERDALHEALLTSWSSAEIGKGGQLDFCTVVLGTASIMFNRAQGAATPPGKQAVKIYLEVADVDALHAALNRKGVAISDPFDGSEVGRPDV